MKDSVVVISSAAENNARFGSGFLIEKTDAATYWLTCAHVILDVGGVQSLRVAGEFAATLIGIQEQKLPDLKNTHDLAVLEVRGLFHKKKLTLGSPQAERNRRGQFRSACRECIIAGHFKHPNVSKIYYRDLHGEVKFDGSGALSNGKDYIQTLELNLGRTGSVLEPGYSGSPVILPDSKAVVGIVDQRIKQGEQGLAISIDAARKFFGEVPELRSALQDKILLSEAKFLEWSLELMEKPLVWRLSSSERTLNEWLKNSQIIARRSLDYILSEDSITDDIFERLSNSNKEKYEKILDDFCWEMEQYVDCIRASILNGRNKSLKNIPARPSLPPTVYEVAFKYLTSSIPLSVEQVDIKKLEDKISQLMLDLYN